MPRHTRLRRFDWDRVQVAVVAGFHLLAAFTILAAPTVQVVTVGTLPVFDLAPRPVWAVGFAGAGIAATMLAVRVTLWRQLTTWFAVVILGSAWTTAICVAVIEGRGSAVAAIVWPTLLIMWGISAVRIALHSDLTGG